MSGFAQSISGEYTLMSMTGVPSNGVQPPDLQDTLFTSRRSTMQSETGFGRSGDRMANTPFSADVPGGIARRTVRSARSNQQRTQRCFLPSICQRAGRYFSSITISEMVSDRRPCRGASPFAL